MANRESLIDNDMLDKLIEKMVHTMAETRDLNILVRRLPGSAEALAEINARLDTTQFAMKEIERSIQGTVVESQGIRKAIEEILATCKDLRTAFSELPGKISIPSEKIDGLSKDIVALTAQLGVPLKQQVVHHHHFNEWWFATVFFCLTTIGLLILLSKR